MRVSTLAFGALAGTVSGTIARVYQADLLEHGLLLLTMALIIWQVSKLFRKWGLP